MSAFPKFKKDRRQNIGLVVIGAGVACFVYFNLLWFRFMASQPREPTPSLGFSYPMNNHGWVYYLSASQSTQLGFLMPAFFIFSFVGAVIYGITLSKKKKEPWEKFPVQQDKGSPAFFLISLLVVLLLLSLVCPRIAEILVSRGVVLDAW
jgi:hypothetical protein